MERREGCRPIVCCSLCAMTRTLYHKQDGGKRVVEQLCTKRRGYCSASR